MEEESIPIEMDNSKTTAKQSKGRSRGRGSSERRKQRRAEQRAKLAELTSNEVESTPPPLVDLRLIIEGRRHEATCRSERVGTVEFNCSLKITDSSMDIRDESSSTNSCTLRRHDHLLPEPTSNRRPSTHSCDSGISTNTTRLSDQSFVANKPVRINVTDTNQKVNSSRPKFVHYRSTSSENDKYTDAINPVRMSSSYRDQSTLEEDFELPTRLKSTKKTRVDRSLEFHRSPIKNSDGSILTALDVPSPVKNS